MRFIPLLLLVFLISCNQAEKKMEEQNQLLKQILEQVQSSQLKLQKNSTFTPECTESLLSTRSYYGSPKCPVGTEPACGTISGSGEMNVYCINLNDIITATEPTCIEGRSYCFQKTLE